MKDSNLIISEFYAKQNEFNYLQKLSLHRNICEDGCSEYYIDMILCADPFSQNNKKLEINFSGVRNFKLGDLDGLFALLICVIDISADQMEGINYKVKEDENDLFSFYCKNIAFKEIT